MRRRGRGWFAAFFLLVPAGVVAQTSRTAVIEQQVRDKEQALRPYEPGRLEKLALLAESPFDPSKPSTAVRSGWYPLFGTLPLRGGLSFGAGYRTRLPGRATADASLALSFRGYRQLQTGVTVPELGGGPIDVRVSARFRDYPRERFFGIGGDALVGDRVSYTMRDVDYVVALTAHPNEWLKAGLDAGYLSSALRPGRDSRFPSVE
ncbi:MAG: hypothetical protein HY654_05300, partial [Acidobacteria bacterium]|nr:hypothetical protein [Acidobacteriota bacterium]